MGDESKVDDEERGEGGGSVLDWGELGITMGDGDTAGEAAGGVGAAGKDFSGLVAGNFFAKIIFGGEGGGGVGGRGRATTG